MSSSFLPVTLGAWAAIVAAILSSIAAIVGYMNRKHLSTVDTKVQEVHVLVNSNLTAIKEQLEDMTSQRDRLEEEAVQNEPKKVL